MPPFFETQQPFLAVQPLGTAVVLRALSWSTVYTKPAMAPVPVAVSRKVVAVAVQVKVK